ncbi:hypothetical protein LCGC14_0360220 [marine sediment metagenome]|uniref:Uncharacterized protein n=1 Tax=marine sediment metagenome TaxID=412755 RepID=A0A0F9WGH9_9ZZZZ
MIMKKPDLNESSRFRRYKIGTRYADELGRMWRYVKIDFGVAGKIKNKAIRNIIYKWSLYRL